MGKLIKVLILGAVVASGLTIAGCSSDSDTVPAPQVGSPAPDFQLRLDGQSVSLGSLRGRQVMLNFWATWCGPCQFEMSFIQEVFEDTEWTEQGLVILAVNIGEPPSNIKRFMEDYGLSFAVLMDADGSVAQDYNVGGIPATFFIDENGIMKDSKIGAFSGAAEIDWRLVNSILEGE